VNVVANDLQPREKIVPEFVQHDMTPEKLTVEMRRQLTDDKYAAAMRTKLAVIRTKLGSAGASEKVAEGIIELAA
jgi:lipid-A-disaccharide synthase